jgi:hypothetical protein
MVRAFVVLAIIVAAAPVRAEPCELLCVESRGAEDEPPRRDAVPFLPLFPGTGPGWQITGGVGTELTPEAEGLDATIHAERTIGSGRLVLVPTLGVSTVTIDDLPSNRVSAGAMLQLRLPGRYADVLLGAGADVVHGDGAPHVAGTWVRFVTELQVIGHGGWFFGARVALPDPSRGSVAPLEIGAFLGYRW